MSTVPPFKQYYPSLSDMNSSQKQFYELWLSAWQKRQPIGVEGQVSYLFCYVYSILGKIVDLSPETIQLTEGVTLEFPSRKIITKGAEEELPELVSIKDTYSNEEIFFMACCHWISDCFVILERFNEAVETRPVISPNSRSMWSTNHLLSLKLIIGSNITGRDILTLCGPRVTTFGKKHLSEVMQYIDTILKSRECETEGNMLMEWVKDSCQYPYSVFSGTHFASPTHVVAYDFGGNKKVAEFIGQLTREAENTVREESNLPKVGEGWIAETELYYEIKKVFPNLEIQHHARPEWLSGQHLDIYIPELNVALEYQGIQHQVSVEHFGGEQAFKRRRYLDARKLRHCKRNDVHLIYVYPTYVLRDILEQLREQTGH